VWVLAGTRLLARVGASERTQDYGFLAGTGEQRLADLDGDGAPEVIHKEGTNRESTIAVFRTPPLALGGGGLAPAPADPRPPVSVLRLTGFLLDPEFVDLDGDRRLDLVVTTIPIDAKNTLRALGGSVASSTRAFLNRERAGRGFYGASPEASVASDIDVALRYTAEGNIEVRRSFTIVAAGDFDGDGRRDLAIRTGPDVITLRRGVPEGVWEPEGRKVPIPALGKSPDIAGHPADLDGDGKDELVLIYSRPDGGRDRVFVLRP
jgi:hypothetical protein